MGLLITPTPFGHIEYKVDSRRPQRRVRRPIRGQR
jgi:hypothetical protein